MSANGKATHVIKVGSSLLVAADGMPRREWLAALVADIAGLAQNGIRPVIVCSGSIALGAKKLGLDKGGRASLPDAQAAASVGQILLAGLWAELLAEHGITAAQILLTLHDMEERRRYLNATATLRRLLDNDAVPVINENDSVATDEIRFGDNDRLAARVAQAVGADRLILLSDVDGLYDRNPATHADARLLSEVAMIDEHVMAMADGGSSSGMGSGGMTSKLQAARIANLAGIETWLISGIQTHPLQRHRDHGGGTHFLANRNENARKSWLGGRLTSAGTLTVDSGASTALAEGNSLLAAGITAIDGAFERSDVVDILDGDGTVIARGLSEYDAADLARIIGRRNAGHEGLLGYTPRSAVVHRNQLVMV